MQHTSMSCCERQCRVYLCHAAPVRVEEPTWRNLFAETGGVAFQQASLAPLLITSGKQGHSTAWRLPAAFAEIVELQTASSCTAEGMQTERVYIPAAGRGTYHQSYLVQHYTRLWTGTAALCRGDLVFAQHLLVMLVCCNRRGMLCQRRLLRRGTWQRHAEDAGQSAADH